MKIRKCGEKLKNQDKKGGFRKYPQKYAVIFGLPTLSYWIAVAPRQFDSIEYGFLEVILTNWLKSYVKFLNIKHSFQKKALKSIKLSFNSVWIAE